jgi:hypothetical protein
MNVFSNCDEISWTIQLIFHVISIGTPKKEGYLLIFYSSYKMKILLLLLLILY